MTLFLSPQRANLLRHAYKIHGLNLYRICPYRPNKNVQPSKMAPRLLIKSILFLRHFAYRLHSGRLWAYLPTRLSWIGLPGTDTIAYWAQLISYEENERVLNSLEFYLLFDCV
jgi:hypothetical protein